MIIEIKDLPEGRKVSRILVDVTFDDTGTHQSVSTEFINESSPNTKPSPKTGHKAPETPVEAIVGPEIKRDPAMNLEIPPEMRDMEF